MATVCYKFERKGEYIAMDQASFWENIGYYSPLLVQSQTEFDYLSGMQFMISKNYTVLLDGRDENLTGFPPSYIEVRGL